MIRTRRVFFSGIREAFLILLFAQGLAGCRSAAEIMVRQGPPTHLGEQRVAVAKAVFLADAFLKEEATKDKDTAFTEGVYVGHLYLAGGYVVVETGRGMQYRSKTITFSERARYRELATAWVDRSISEALTWRRIAFVSTEALSLEVLPELRRREVRGSGPLDLHDNQNLPRFELEPTTLPRKALEALPDLEGAPLLLQPFVVNYYSHNGGWFVGQTYGSGAGARIRLLWALYDTSDGRVLRWGEIQGRHVEKYIFSPNSAQIDDYLIEVEEAVTKELRRRLLR